MDLYHQSESHRRMHHLEERSARQPGHGNPRFRHLRKIIQRIRDYGFFRTVIYTAFCLEDAWGFWRRGIGPAMRATQFWVPAAESGSPSADYRPYGPTVSFHAFRAVMDRYVLPRQEDVFLDYGSGAGRVLMMAATYPFRRVIGVEYDGELVSTAARIIRPIEHRLRCPNIELVQADAAEFEVPPDVTVIYLYNSFAGPVLEAACERIRESLLRHPRDLRIVGFNPGDLKRCIAGCDWLAQFAEVRFPSISVSSFAVFRSVRRGSGKTTDGTEALSETTRE